MHEIEMDRMMQSDLRQQTASNDVERENSNHCENNIDHLPEYRSMKADDEASRKNHEFKSVARRMYA